MVLVPGSLPKVFLIGSCDFKKPERAEQGLIYAAANREIVIALILADGIPGPRPDMTVNRAMIIASLCQTLLHFRHERARMQRGIAPGGIAR